MNSILQLENFPVRKMWELIVEKSQIILLPNPKKIQNPKFKNIKYITKFWILSRKIVNEFNK